jgi:lysophospholipase L1-like esterase
MDLIKIGEIKKIVITIYLVSLHVLLGAMLFKTDIAPHVESKLNLIMPKITEEESIIPIMRDIHNQIDTSVPAGATIFLGDSITMYLATSAISSHTVNYGIGWQRSDQLVESMDIYKSIGRATRVIVTIGTNDLLQNKEDGIESRYQAILTKIPAKTEVIMSSIPPIGTGIFYGRKIDDDDVRKVVATAKTVCEADLRCRFVNAYEALTTEGQPLPGVLLDDNIHLSPKGYELWINAIRHVVTPQNM